MHILTEINYNYINMYTVEKKRKEKTLLAIKNVLYLVCVVACE